MYNREDLKKFIDYGMREAGNSTLTIFIMHLVVVISYFTIEQSFKLIIVHAVLVAVSLAIFLIEKFKHSLKNQCLATGVIAIIAAIHSWILCAGLYNTTIKRTIVMLLILIIANFCTFGLVIIISRKMLKQTNKFFSKAGEAALITGFAGLGVVVARYVSNIIYSKDIFLIVYGLVSVVFTFFTIYLVKWYYIRVLEKM